MTSLMRSNAKINLLRDLRQLDEKGWLKPEDYIYFLVKYIEIENSVAEAVRQVKPKPNAPFEVEKIMQSLSKTNLPLTNFNPNNVKGKFRYPWSRNELVIFQSLRGTL